MAPRVLTTRALNRALLARQLLLERSKVPLARAVEAIGGIQSQYAPSAYVGLWSRLEDFRREALTVALEERRVIQGTLMRATIHIVSAKDYWLFAAAIRNDRREWWRRVQAKDLKGLDMERVAAAVRKHLAGGPLRQKELVERLAAQGFSRIAWAGAGMWLDLVRVPPSGTWDRRRADLYGLAEDWVEPPEVDPEEAAEHLVRRYFAAFGPASIGDLAGWAGLPVATLRPTVDRLSLRRFSDQAGGELLDLPRAPLPDPQTRAPVRFLPTFDATLLVQARRTQILPERYRPLVFNTKTPHSMATFLVDGQVAGMWRYEKERLRLEPFDGLIKAARAEVEEEAERLAAFHRPGGGGET